MSTQTTTIAKLNDEFRRAIFNQPPGHVVMTQSLRAVFQQEAIIQILTKIRDYDDFHKGNDPYGEHDFGAFDQDEERILWKIDYYDQNLEFGSENPADPTITKRVMTIMQPQDW